MKTEITYNYFTATLTGWRGSHGCKIAEVSGCWDTEAQAESALQEKCAKKEQEYADRMGITLEEAQERSYGWLSDYRSVATTYSATPIYNGKLIHALSRELSPGELPEWTVEDFHNLGYDSVEEIEIVEAK